METEAGIMKAVKNRRSYYDYTKESTLADEELKALLRQALYHVPTAAQYAAHAHRTASFRAARPVLGYGAGSDT